MKSGAARAWFSPVYSYLAIDEAFRPSLSALYTEANLQRRFIVRGKLRRDVSALLTMDSALKGRGKLSRAAASEFDRSPPDRTSGGPRKQAGTCIPTAQLRTMRPEIIARRCTAIGPYTMALAAISSFKDFQMMFAPAPIRYSVQATILDR
jgi:hypothetical protein